MRDPLTYSVHHDPRRQRFEALVEGQSCVVDYRRHGDTVTFVHTGVPPALRHQGIAAEMVQHALDWARAEGLKVIPACSYVSVYMRRHPASLDLMATRGSKPGAAA